jgi:hypothetical protein
MSEETKKPGFFGRLFGRSKPAVAPPAQEAATAVSTTAAVEA